MGSVQAVQTSTEKEAKRGPETTAPQDPEELKATPEPQLFTRRQCLSETEEEQQEPQPVWDKEPTFWSDTLTQELWKLFRENPENQQAQEGEGPSLTGWGECFGCPGKPHCSPSLFLLTGCHGDRGAAGTGEYPWLGTPTHICPTMPLPLHP